MTERTPPISPDAPDAIIRREHLLPFSEGWAQPGPVQVREILRQLELSAADTAQMIGHNEGRTTRRWKSGETNIPYAVWAILCLDAGYGRIWKR